ncbi:circadian clock protein KaiC [Candidatus Halobeggiatoa sp. HSG11]|nr:circadian clock protein KaiC [Candidatus Halobeggiatoa sp. HSG11]
MQNINTKPVPLPKIQTGINGLDQILEGGLPFGRPTVISGGHGCGKSILGLEFLYRGALRAESGILMNFEESATNIRANALTLGWDFAALEEQGLMLIVEARMDPRAIISGEFSLEGLLTTIEAAAKQMKVTRVVLDSVDVLLRFLNDPERERQELYYLYDWLTEHQLTTILTTKRMVNTEEKTRYEYIDFLVDCVIYLEQRIEQRVATRNLRISKYRGSGFGRNEYPYTITAKGISIIPISTNNICHQTFDDYICSGHPRLDVLLGGGYRRGSCTLIAGGTGAGKSVVAATFIRQTCDDKGKVLYICFEESQEAIIKNMQSPGIKLQPAVGSDKLRFIAVMPEAMGAEDHLIRAIDIIKEWQPQHVVVDAISACDRMGSEQIAYEYVMRLLNFCKERGITTLFLKQVASISTISTFSRIDLSSLIDSILVLNLVEVGGEINRTALVYKSRGTAHSNQYREFLITNTGIDLLDVYTGEGGVLTGTARKEREAIEETELVKQKQFIVQKEAELEQQQQIASAATAAAMSKTTVLEAELEVLNLAATTRVKNIMQRTEMRSAEEGESGADAYRLQMERTAIELRQFINNANAPVFGIDKDGNVTEWNKTTKRLTGYSKDEVEGKNLVATYITDDYKIAVKSVLDNALCGNETANFEFPLYTKNGDRLKILLNASTQRDAEGNISGVIGVGQDITAIDEYRERQERTAMEWVQFINNANAPVFGIDKEGNVTEWNKTTERLTGYSKDEVQGKNLVATYITDDYKTAVKSVLDNALQGDETANFEFPLYSKNGDRLKILLNASTQRDADGNINGVIGVGQDITAIDEYRERQERTAMEWVQFVNNANAPVFGVDTDGNINEWNKKTETLTGYTKDEVEGKNLVEEFITDDYKQAVKDVLDKSLQGNETANYELPLFTKTKQRLVILLNATTRRDIDDVVIGVIGVGQDITELKLMRERK